jgi:hypothetical protein
MLQSATKIVKNIGQTFGESALTPHSRRNAAVVVPTHTILAQLYRDDYLRVVAGGYESLIGTACYLTVRLQYTTHTFSSCFTRT